VRVRVRVTVLLKAERYTIGKKVFII